MNRGLHWAVPILGVLLLACGGGPSRTATGSGEAGTPRYPGTLAVLEPDGRDHLVRQRVTFERGERRGAADVVLQKLGDELTVVALTPLGGRAYVIRQRGTEAPRVEQAPGAPVPVPPEFVLLDIHRVYFLRLGAPPSGEGTVRGLLQGEAVEEDWRGGRCVERRFSRAEFRERGPIRVRFGAGPADAAFPSAELTNPWLGYRLSITTLADQRIPSGTATRSAP